MTNNEEEFARLNFAIDIWNEGLCSPPKKNRVVLASGCFDVLGLHHIKLLEFASKEGDILVVGINSDRSIKKLKGPNRPIYSEQERYEILKAIKWVDFVFVVDAIRVTDLILTLKPSIWCKGADYNLNTLNEEEKAAADRVGAEIKFFDYIPGYSSTKTIEKLKT